MFFRSIVRSWPGWIEGWLARLYPTLNPGVGTRRTDNDVPQCGRFEISAQSQVLAIGIVSDGLWICLHHDSIKNQWWDRQKSTPMELMTRLFQSSEIRRSRALWLYIKTWGFPSLQVVLLLSSVAWRTRSTTYKFSMSNEDSKEFYTSEPLAVSTGSSEDRQGLWKRTKARAALQLSDSRMSPGTKWSNKGVMHLEPDDQFTLTCYRSWSGRTRRSNMADVQLRDLLDQWCFRGLKLENRRFINCYRPFLETRISRCCNRQSHYCICCHIQRLSRSQTSYSFYCMSITVNLHSTSTDWHC